MREIKFRVWHRLYKMVKLDSISFKGNGEFSHITTIGGSAFKNQEGFILMQFTGLLDKNGKEVFEGDIVKIPYIDPMGGINYEEKNDPEYLGKVVYLRGSFMIDRNYNPEPILFDRYFVKKQGEYVSNYGNISVYDESPIFEVIGNIYENPELIK